MEEKRNQKKFVVVLAIVLGLVLLTVAGTYALFVYSRQGEQENTLTTGKLYFVYDEKSANPDNKVNIQNAFPMTDDNGKIQTEPGMFEFEVRATTQGVPIYYEVYLTKNEDSSTLDENVVDTYLTSVDGNETPITNEWTENDVNLYNKLWISQLPSLLDSDIVGKTLVQDEVSENQDAFKKTYRYRMWIDESADQVDDNGTWLYGGKTFTVNVNVYASNDPLPAPIEPTEEGQDDNYKDTSGANSPVLAEGMIPAVYKEGNWVVADNTSSAETPWYDYTKQEWANAVTVVEDQRETLAKAPKDTVIEEQYINTMWVWIPRYEYDTTNLGTSYASGTKTEPGAINIKFIDGTGTGSGENYKVHPAFKFGSDELEGFWYGKFETSNKEQSCTAKDYSAGTDCDQATFTPQIKPNAISWRGIRPSTAFTVSQKMVTDFKTEYGFSGTEDTHMSKNSEWGAVAYLSQSTYGKYGNSKYSGTEREVYKNNCSQYKTGIAGTTVSASSDATCANTYETENGQKASTTGNITGVYDMSGGAYEYVMGVLADDSGSPRSGYQLSSNYNSGFNGTCSSGDCSKVGIDFPNEKYYDLYKGTDAAKACEDGTCYGHALSETSGWYSDSSSFVSATVPWFVRGGGYYYSTSNAGVFYFNVDYGYASGGLSFRLVLVPRAVA